MTELPSRDTLRHYVSGYGVMQEYPGAALILDAYLSGRLIDREVIDYDRVEEILDELCRDWYDMVIREGKTFDFGAAIRAIVAALGGER